MKALRFAAPLLLCLVPAALLAASDPFLGKWVLDTKVSRYPNGFCPKQMTIEMTMAGSEVHYHSQTVMVNGNSFTADYTADYDERPAVVKGAKGILLPVSLKRPQPDVVIANYMSGLQVRATSRRVISQQGRIMTITTTSQDGAGNSVTNVSVYRKSPSAPSGSFTLSQAKSDLF